MKISHIEHLGIAVKSLEEAIPFWENILGFKCYSIEEVADQKVKTAFFKVGQTKIELLEPTSEESTIAKFIANRGEGVHHVAYAVENIEEALAEAESKGVRLIDKTRRGAEGLTIAFLHPKSTGGCPDGALRGQEREMIPQHVTAPRSRRAPFFGGFLPGPAGAGDNER